MVWQAIAGNTFLVRPRPQEKEHIFFVLNSPMALDCFGGAACVTVSASTPHEKCDRSCMIPPGCHPFITHESFIYCSKAVVYPAENLEKLVNTKVFGQHDAVPLDLIKHIVAGLIRSDHTNDDIRVACGRIFDAMIEAARP